MPWRTLHQNVALGLPHGTGRREGRERVDQLLELVGLDAHAGHRPREVSGGMAQRTSLARALARRPGVLLLDEPFGALDAITRGELQLLVRDIQREFSQTMLMVTHDIAEASAMGTQIGVLDAGRLIAWDRPDAIWRSTDARVRRLLDAGCEVVVGTCPDLGTVQPIAPPLRQVARTWSRRIAAAQTIGVIEEGGRTVSLGDILGPEFAAAPALLFGPDQFHPSVEGYRALAGVLVPSVLAALEHQPEEETILEAFRGEAVLPVTRAAIKAVKEPGTELGGAEAGADTTRPAGVRGRLVELRHRRRRQHVPGEAPEAHEGAEAPAE